MKDNQPEQEYFNQLDATLAVNELDNETAAAIQGGHDLEVYRHANYGDRMGSYNIGWSDLSSKANANDQISSVIVNAGQWRFYEHANYQGASFVVGRGGWNVPSNFNDRISSIDQVGDGIGPS